MIKLHLEVRLFNFVVVDRFISENETGYSFDEL
jgi:hypothetical protein